MRVLTLSAIIVSATATASCARRCGTACRAATSRQAPVAFGGALPPIVYGGGGFPQPGFPQFPYPQFPYPQPWPQPGFPQPGFPQFPYPQPWPQPGWPQPGYPPNYYYPPLPPQPQFPPPAPVYPGFYPPPQQNPFYPYPPYPGVAPGCEGAAGRCSCDSLCITFNDCCADYVYYCGSPETAESPFGTKTDGQSCGATAFGDAGKCMIGFDCVCVDECADPDIADAPSTCKSGACNKICPILYQPLCGTDGFQYANRCEFDIAVCQFSYLQIAYDGECRAPTVAPPTVPVASCSTLFDCVSCASVYQCVWDGRTCFSSIQQLPPPFVNTPAQCPVNPQSCPVYTDCTTCATAPGCTWFGAYCQYSQWPVAGYPNDPRMCPANPATCTASTTCETCTANPNSGCYWGSNQQCVYSPTFLPLPTWISNPQQCYLAPPPPQNCATQTSCYNCAILNGCSWSGSYCINSLTPITGCAQYGCANNVNECPAPAPGGR